MMKERTVKGKYTIADIAASLPEEKNSNDSVWTRWILRPLSYPPTWLLLKTGLSPNAVSFLSAGVVVLGGLCLALGSGAWFWIGIALSFAFSVLDCVDGNMARTTRTRSPWGAWSDALGGYVAYTAILIGFGAAFDPLLGGIAASANLLMRVVVQSRRVAELTLASERPAEAAAPKPQDARPGLEKRISENIGITGIMVPLFALAAATGTAHWALAGYAALYSGGALVVIAKLVIKTLAEERMYG